MELKDRIREAMEGAKLRPLQLAHACGVSSGAVTHWLDGRTKSLKAETAENIQAATGYSASWIVNGSGPKLMHEASEKPLPQSGLSPSAIELAILYDLIPIADRIRRAIAYNAATAAILDVLQGQDASGQATPGHKKQSA
jgi:transcriptional regulator with XRE-family HTH domain